MSASSAPSQPVAPDSTSDGHVKSIVRKVAIVSCCLLIASVLSCLLIYSTIKSADRRLSEVLSSVQRTDSIHYVQSLLRQHNLPSEVGRGDPREYIICSLTDWKGVFVTQRVAVFYFDAEYRLEDVSVERLWLVDEEPEKFVLRDPPPQEK